MSTQNFVYWQLDFDLGPGEDRFEVHVRVPDGKILVIRECQVELTGDAGLSLEQSWCVLTGEGISDGGLDITVNGTAPNSLRPPRLLLNRVTETKKPAGGFLSVIGPANVYLPTVGEVILYGFRNPAAAAATGHVALTGTISS